MNFICGNEFKALCDFSFDEEGIKENKNKNQIFKEPLVFIKTDYIFDAIEKVADKPTRIITHNSDLCIDEKYIPLLDSKNIIHWYAQNISINHAKLSPIPIGIANPKWPHGNKQTLKEVINKNNKKTNLVYANFTVSTNPTERNLCLEAVKRNGIDFVQGLPFDEYLDDLSRSMFSISPNGNGIDCHKTWESLYLKNIPIVTRSINSEQYSDLPILIIDKWSDLDILNLNEDLYKSKIKNFNRSYLNIEKFIKNEHSAKSFCEEPPPTLIFTKHRHE
tara:strand:- start:170 stop:1000 length:831 start_codon:yes stop_codon:yes gene_type:complete